MTATQTGRRPRLVAAVAASPLRSSTRPLRGEWKHSCQQWPRRCFVTPRESEIWLLIARGLTNSEIAQQLVIGEATVKTHVARVLAKLGARDRIQAVVLAYEAGLV